MMTPISIDRTRRTEGFLLDPINMSISFRLTLWLHSAVSVFDWGGYIALPSGSRGNFVVDPHRIALII